ncbi:MAG: hypothetical protein CW338_10645 [Clostridiales bacterium]|nr:hypothetical protein [Clostridiales bacterium]
MIFERMDLFMKKCKDFGLRFPWLYAIFGLILLLAAVILPALVFRSPEAPWDGVREIISAVIVFAVFGLFVGYDRLKFTSAGMKEGFRFMRVLFIVMAALIGTGALYSIISGQTEHITWQKGLGLILMLSVGIVEEFTCRGMIFGGLLKKYGKTAGGIIVSALISSVLFGAVHILTALIQNKITDLNTILQAIGKIVSSGAFGLVMAFIYLKVRNVWVPAAVHSVYDGILLVSTLFMAQGAGQTEYVTKQGGISNVLIYVVMTLVMLPFIIKAVKQIKKMELPVPCPLEDEWYADMK